MKLFARIKQSKVFKRFALMASAVVVAAMGAIGASAETTSPSAPAQTDIVAGINTVTSSVFGQLTITNIAAILGICVASCIGLMLFWWGGRKVVRMIMAAFKKGQLKI